jgi:glycosyltransferase 2 family protein
LKFERLAFAAGLGLFLWLLHRIGLESVGLNLARIGWGFAAVLALEAVAVLLMTLGWSRTLPRERRVPFFSLVAMRMAGDGVNALAPAAVVGGEIVHARLLARFLPGAEALGSVGLAAMAQFLAQVLFVGAGLIIARSGALAPRLRLLGLGLLAFLAAFLVLLERLSRRREGPPGRIARWLGHVARVFSGGVPPERFLRDLDRAVFGSLREHPLALAVAVLLFLSAWLVHFLEVALVLALLGAPVPVGTAFAIAVLTVLVEGLFFFVPARIGIQEGGLYAIFLALGLDPARGFSLGVIRRLREMTWGLAGLTILALYRRRTAPLPTPE